MYKFSNLINKANLFFKLAQNSAAYPEIGQIKSLLSKLQQQQLKVPYKVSELVKWFDDLEKSPSNTQKISDAINSTIDATEFAQNEDLKQKLNSLKEKIKSAPKQPAKEQNYPKDLQEKLNEILANKIQSIPVDGKLSKQTWDALNLFYKMFKKQPIPENINLIYNLYKSQKTTLTPEQLALSQEGEKLKQNMVQGLAGSAPLTQEQLEMVQQGKKLQENILESFNLPSPIDVTKDMAIK